MLLDQFALAPSFLACFLALTGFLGGHSREEVWLKLKKDYKDTLITNYYVSNSIHLYSSVENLGGNYCQLRNVVHNDVSLGHYLTHPSL
ncbi:protein Mpv17-like [Rhincodon typus]|uniref:protein Mpv17-like n=1 Tax=Rhincodon typus TaxID=259920 RepID=UPI00202F3518|nr:protein Mpv17-like [Rhincodon typus]